MKTFRFPFFLSLFVCCGALAAPPMISFESGAAWALVPPGHRAAWINNHDAYSIGMATDSDKDGRIWMADDPNSGEWIVIDVDTGEWQTANLPLLAGLEPGSIVPGPTGAYTHVFAPSFLAYFGSPLWVRPGVGAWGLGGHGKFGVTATTSYGNYAVLDVSHMFRMESSPARPAGIEHGDVFLMLGGTQARVGVVDAQSAAPSSPGLIRMSSAGGMVDEASNVRLHAIRMKGTDGTVTVRCTASGTAEPGIDYTFEPVELTFAPGEVVKEIPLTLLDDGTYNASPRSVLLQLSNPSGGAELAALVTRILTLKDDDAAPVLAFGDIPSRVIEGDASWYLDVPWTITGAFRGTLPVHLETTVDSSDYSVTPNQTAHTAKVLIPANDLADHEKFIELKLSTSLPRINGIRTSLVVIDDDPPRLVIDDAVEIERYGQAKLTLLTETPATGAGSVLWTTVDGTAKAGEDYTPQSGTLTVYPSFQATISLELLDDSANEGSETFYVDVTSVTGGILPPERTRIAVTLIDDDAPPPGVSAQGGSVREQDITDAEAIVRVTLERAMSTVVRLSFSATTESTAAPGDFKLPAPLVFLPGETTKEAIVRITGDGADEEVETVQLSIRDSWGNVVATTTLTILDDDTQSFISVADAEVDETPGGNSYLVFRVTFSKAPEASGRFRYVTGDLTAKVGTDYVATHGTIQFGPNDVEKEIRVEVLDDDLIEVDEQFRLRLYDVTGDGVYLHRDVATAIIRDNDPYGGPIITLAASSVFEGNAGQQIVPVSIRLATASIVPITVTVTTTTGTAKADDDYLSLAQTFTFQPGQTAKTIPLVINGDTVAEENETIELNATHQGAVIASTTLKIMDDDKEPSRRRSSRH